MDELKTERDKDVLHIREELNLVNKGLISIQRQIPPHLDHWTRAFDRHGIPSEITCRAPREFGVPHGLDNDVSLALQEEFIALGCPEDRTVRITAYRLLQLCGLTDTGKNRQNLRESLDRMRSTTYWIKELWRDHGRGAWSTVTFSLLDGLEYETREDDPRGVQLIAATLPRQIAHSLRDGYVKPVDMRVLRELNITSRAAYRALDSLRHDVENPEKRVDVLQLRLVDLRVHFGLTTDRLDTVRRQFDAIREDLVNVGYLASAQISGRGQKQVVTFVFGSAARDADPALVAKLMAHKVSRAVAERLALDHPERIDDGVALFAALVSSGYRPRSLGGLLVDVVKTLPEGKYAWPEGVPGRPRVLDAPKPDAPPGPSATSRPDEPLVVTDAQIAAALALVLQLPKADLLRLPRTILDGLKTHALAPGADKKAVAASARAMIASLAP